MKRVGFSVGKGVVTGGSRWREVGWRTCREGRRLKVGRVEVAVIIPLPNFYAAPFP